jgi:hypothetical protein
MAWMLRSFAPAGKKRDVEPKAESDKTLVGSRR